MRYFDHTLRILWGLHYLVFGLNKLIIFQPVSASNAFAQTVIDSFYATGYLMQTVGIIQFISGLLITFNRYMNLAILLALPITFNILLYTCFTTNFSANALATATLVIFANGYFIFKRKGQLAFLLNKN